MSAVNEFAAQDAVGRLKTKAIFPKYHFVESKDDYAVWDLSGMTQNLAGDDIPFLIEVKDREVASYTYDTTYMEFKKYQALLKIADANNIQDVFYVVHFKNELAYVFNMKNIKIYDLKLTVQNAPATKYGTTNRVDKIFIELDIDKGKRYMNK